VGGRGGGLGGTRHRAAVPKSGSRIFRSSGGSAVQALQGDG
jgi:hypothetical protein